MRSLSSSRQRFIRARLFLSKSGFVIWRRNTRYILLIDISRQPLRAFSRIGSAKSLASSILRRVSVRPSQCKVLIYNVAGRRKSRTENVSGNRAPRLIVPSLALIQEIFDLFELRTAFLARENQGLVVSRRR